MSETFAPDEIAILQPYVTNVERPIFALRNLPEEVVAVLFAYYSRSRESLRRNLLKLIREQDLDLDRRLRWADLAQDDLASAKRKAREFHEKWVVGYGHASVAEHAVAHLAIEDVSIVASKIVEDARLASYTEKSTRYVVFDRDKFYREPIILQSRHARRYQETCGALLDTYTRLTDPLLAAIMRDTPRGARQGDRAFESACRAKTCDVLRYLLPAATLTNIGMTINGRALEQLIGKLLSHPLAEARQVGAAIKAEAQQIIPTLIKYADVNPYLVETRRAMERCATDALDGTPPTDRTDATLVRYPADAEDQLVADLLLTGTRTTRRPDRRPRARSREGREAPDSRRVPEAPSAARSAVRAMERLTCCLFDILVDLAPIATSSGTGCRSPGLPRRPRRSTGTACSNLARARALP